MFLRRSEFYMTIRFSHAFLLLFWGGSGGRSPPENFWGFSGYFSTFSYLWNYFLLFLGGSVGEAPGNFLGFSSFLTRWVNYREFFYVISKNFLGGGRSPSETFCEFRGVFEDLCIRFLIINVSFFGSDYDAWWRFRGGRGFTENFCMT